MPALTRSRAKQLRDERCQLLDLPQEILTEIWTYVLREPQDYGVHVMNEDFGLNDVGSYQISDLEALSVLARLRHPFRCPPILLVNRQIHESAKLILLPPCSFTFCSYLCLHNFIKLIPKHTMSKSVTFYCHDREINETLARRQLIDIYGAEVQVKPLEPRDENDCIRMHLQTVEWHWHFDSSIYS